VELFAFGFVFSLSLCADLGVVNLAILRTGLERGALPAFLLGLGSGLGDLIYALIGLLGAAAVLQRAEVRLALWVGGSAVLLVFAWRMLREAHRPRALVAGGGTSVAHRPPARLVLAGALLALSSPTLILWFGAVGGALLASSAGAIRSGAVPFFGGFVVAGLVWSAGLAWLAARGRRLGGRAVRALALFSAALFAVLAFRLITEGWRELVLGQA
jgi:L-lysine exporter family protein LysE/ArgO